MVGRVICLFGVRRLDAALLSGGLTQIDARSTHLVIEAALVSTPPDLIPSLSGFKPPRTKAASSRRTPKSAKKCTLPNTC